MSILIKYTGKRYPAMELKASSQMTVNASQLLLKLTCLFSHYYGGPFQQAIIETQIGKVTGGWKHIFLIPSGTPFPCLTIPLEQWHAINCHWVICFQIPTFHLCRTSSLLVPLPDGPISAQPHGHCWDGYQVAGILSPAHASWEDVMGCMAASRTTMAEGHTGRISSAWELHSGSWSQPFPDTGCISSEVHPWNMHIYRPLIYRQKSKNWLCLGSNWQLFSPFQNVAITQLGLDPSYPAVCSASMGL